MSTFAPLRVDKGATVEVRRFDVVVWNLEGVFKIQRLIVDISLIVKCTAPELRAVDLVVPFVVRHRRDVECPTDLVVNDLTQPGLIEADLETATYENPIGVVARCPFEVASAAASDDALDITGRSHLPLLDRVSRRASTCSVERFTFVEALARDEQTLIKLRYHVYPPTGLVLWKRSGLGINGAFFEARTAAGAIHANDKLPNLIRSRGVKCESVTMTFVLRASLQLRVGAPHVEPRVIDGRTMEAYLDRLTDFRREGSLVAYTRPATPNDRNEEALLFLDVSREFGLLPIGNYLRIGLLTFCMLAFARWIGLIGHGNYVGIPWRHVWHTIESLYLEILAVALVVLGGPQLTRIKAIATWLSSGRNAWHRLDRWIWRLL